MRTQGTLLAQVIEADIGRQPEEPGAERRLAAVLVELAMRGQENVLQQVFAMAPPDHAARQAEEPRSMSPIELFESRRFARPAPRGQLDVWMSLHVVRHWL